MKTTRTIGFVALLTLLLVDPGSITAAAQRQAGQDGLTLAQDGKPAAVLVLSKEALNYQAEQGRRKGKRGDGSRP